MSLNLTGSQVIDKIRELASENPEHVYPKPESHPDMDKAENATCFYVHHDGDTLSAGCIVGQALAALGVPLTDLAQHENEAGETVVRAFTGTSRTSVPEGDYIQTVQGHQDSGMSWGESVRRADDYYSRHYDL